MPPKPDVGSVRIWCNVGPTVVSNPRCIGCCHRNRDNAGNVSVSSWKLGLFFVSFVFLLLLLVLLVAGFLQSRGFYIGDYFQDSSMPPFSVFLKTTIGFDAMGRIIIFWVKDSILPLLATGLFGRGFGSQICSTYWDEIRHFSLEGWKAKLLFEGVFMTFVCLYCDFFHFFCHGKSP